MSSNVDVLRTSAWFRKSFRARGESVNEFANMVVNRSRAAAENRTAI